MNTHYYRQIATTITAPLSENTLLDTLDMVQNISPTSFTRPVSQEDISRISRAISTLKPQGNAARLSQNQLRSLLQTPSVTVGTLLPHILTLSYDANAYSDRLLGTYSQIINALNHKRYERGITASDNTNLKLQHLLILAKRRAKQMTTGMQSDTENLGSLAARVLTDKIFAKNLTSFEERAQLVLEKIVILPETPWRVDLLDTWLHFLQTLPANEFLKLTKILKNISPLACYKAAQKNKETTSIFVQTLSLLFTALTHGDSSSATVREKKLNLARMLVGGNLTFTWLSSSLFSLHMLASESGSTIDDTFYTDLIELKNKKGHSFFTAAATLLLFDTKSTLYKHSEVVNLYTTHPMINPNHFFSSQEVRETALMLEKGRENQMAMGAVLAKHLLTKNPVLSKKLIELVINDIRPNDPIPSAYLIIQAQSAFDTGHYTQSLQLIFSYGLHLIDRYGSGTVDVEFQTRLKTLLDTIARLLGDASENKEEAAHFSLHIETTDLGETELYAQCPNSAIRITDTMIKNGKECLKKEQHVGQAPQPSDTPLRQNTLKMGPYSNATPPPPVPMPKQRNTPKVRARPPHTPQDTAPLVSQPLPAEPNHPVPRADQRATLRNIKFNHLLKELRQQPNFIRFEEGGSHKIAVYQNNKGGEQRIPVGNKHSGSKSIVAIGTLRSILGQVTKTHGDVSDANG